MNSVFRILSLQFLLVVHKSRISVYQMRFMFLTQSSDDGVVLTHLIVRRSVTIAARHDSLNINRCVWQPSPQLLEQEAVLALEFLGRHLWVIGIVSPN